MYRLRDDTSIHHFWTTFSTYQILYRFYKNPLEVKIEDIFKILFKRVEKQFRHNFPSCESDRSDKKERHCDVALSYTVERLEDWKRKMSSHFGWVASSMGERDNYYDDISLLNSICSRSILFRSRFNIQHRRFVETVRKECQIFIESREWEKNIQVRSGLFQNTRRGNLGSLVDITEIPSNCKLERGRSEGKQKKGRKKEKEKKRKKRTDEKEAKRGIQRDDHPAGGRLSSSRLSPLFQRRNV